MALLSKYARRLSISISRYFSRITKEPLKVQEVRDLFRNGYKSEAFALAETLPFQLGIALVDINLTNRRSRL